MNLDRIAAARANVSIYGVSRNLAAQRCVVAWVKHVDCWDCYLWFGRLCLHPEPLKSDHEHHSYT